jgi:hypothetical protein
MPEPMQPIEREVSHRFQSINLIDRREAIQRVALLLGGVGLVGGSTLLTACRPDAQPGETGFTDQDIAFLDEVAETILPETSTPGAKATQTGAFMAMMVSAGYDARDQEVFRAGMNAIEQACQKAHNVSFMSATPSQRLSVLEPIDRDQKTQSDTLREQKRVKSMAYLTDQRQEVAPGADVGGATAVTTDPPAHYFRMMKELALLGYFTSEIGCKQAQRYVESPGRFDPCVPYQSGEKAWAPHA